MTPPQLGSDRPFQLNVVKITKSCQNMLEIKLTGIIQNVIQAD